MRGTSSCPRDRKTGGYQECGGGDTGVCCWMDTEFPFYQLKKFCRSASPQCQSTERHWTVHLKRVKMVNALSRVSYDMREVTEIALQELCTSIEERKERGGQQKGFYLAWQAPNGQCLLSIINTTSARIILGHRARRSESPKLLKRLPMTAGLKMDGVECSTTAMKSFYAFFN